MEALQIAQYAAGGLLAAAGGYVMFNWWVYWKTNYKGKLLTEGPYARVRHPYYLGFILLVVGVAVVFPDASLIALALFTPIALVYYTGVEEKQLLNTYRKQYEEYRKKVKWRIVPLVW